MSFAGGESPCRPGGLRGDARHANGIGGEGYESAGIRDQDRWCEGDRWKRRSPAQATTALGRLLGLLLATARVRTGGGRGGSRALAAHAAGCATRCLFGRALGAGNHREHENHAQEGRRACPAGPIHPGLQSFCSRIMEQIQMDIVAGVSRRVKRHFSQSRRGRAKRPAPVPRRFRAPPPRRTSRRA